MRLRSQPPEGAPANPHVEELVVRRTPTRRVPVDTPDAPRHVEPAVSTPVVRKMGTAARTGVPRAPEAARPSEATDSGDVAAQAAEAARSRFGFLVQRAENAGMDSFVVAIARGTVDKVAEKAAREAMAAERKEAAVKRLLPGMLDNVVQFYETNQPTRIYLGGMNSENFGKGGVFDTFYKIASATDIPKRKDESPTEPFELNPDTARMLGLNSGEGSATVNAEVLRASMENGGTLLQARISGTEIGRGEGVEDKAIVIMAVPESR
jgi:hypothetical protein